MSDDFEPRVQRWLRERGEVDRATVEAVAGKVAALPPRRTGPRRTWLMTAAAAALVIVAVSVGILVLPRVHSGGPPPTPPDPAAFVGDPRLASCFGGAGEVQYAFEMTHARDYQRYLPNILLAPELDVDDPGFVVVFGSGVTPNVGILGAPGASRGPQTAPPPNRRYVCVFVAGFPNLYSDVDIDGLRATIDGSSTVPTSTPAGDVLPDPSAFRDDPRFTACADQGRAVSALEVAHARDVRRYLPGFTGREPELDTDLPALVVIMGADYVAPPYPGPSGIDEAPPSSGPTDRYVCVVVGPRDGPTEVGCYFASITGFEPNPAGIETPPPNEASPTPEPVLSDQTPWLDSNGALVSTETIQSSPGASHCGWDSVTLLWLVDAQYLRDPQDVLADRTLAPFALDVSLPVDAVDTGFHTRDWHVFTVPAGDAVYVRTGDGTLERWGRARTEVGCQ